MRWIRPAARPYLDADADLSPAEALRVLEVELNAPRRYAGGSGALVLLLAAGLVAALALDLRATEGAGVIAAAAVLAVALAVTAAWLAGEVIGTGRTVVAAYARWSRADSGAATTPAGLVQRAFAGPWLAREALTAGAFLLTVLAAVLVVLPLTGTLEDAAAVVPLGVAGLIGFGTATWCLLVTDLRAGWLHGRRIGRGHERRRR